MASTTVRLAHRRCGRHLAALARNGPEGPPTMKQVHAFLTAADECFAGFMHAQRVAEAVAPALRALALRESFDAFVRHRTGGARASSGPLAQAWNRAAEALGLRTARLPLARRAARPAPATPDTLETVEVFEVAVAAHLSSLVASQEGRTAIRRLMTQLHLSYDEAGRALGVNGETVRRWDHAAPIPPEKQGGLTAANSALTRLLHMFLPHALPTVVRTPAELFGGERALDRILRGRIADVADAYELALQYQP